MTAVDRRLAAIASVLLPGPERPPAEAGAEALLAELAGAVRRSGRNDELWLLVVGLTTVFPAADELLAVRRRLELAEPGAELPALLEATRPIAVALGHLDRDLELVVGGIVVDVDFCATHVHNTGIQRVVRQTMARWERQARPVTLVGGFADASGLRTLTAVERRRVVSWRGAAGALTDDPAERDAVLVVPFRSVVLLPEVPEHHRCDRLAALAEFSGNRVGAIAYDTIPIASADAVPLAETERFAHYLTIVKHVDRMAAISNTAAEEFRGFAGALAAQGLPGPEVEAVVLPVELPDLPDAPPEAAAGPERLIVCVGSQEPRKNQLAVLFAAEVLWREGHEFALQFIGGGSRWFTRRMDRAVRRLVRKGRQVTVRRGLADAEIVAAYRQAMFTVFPSTHEGYGLPVAEALTLGVPVVTTGYGSTAEIAAGGGCALVDPRDDESLIEVLRRLLTHPAEVEELRRQAVARGSRSWNDYATDLWDRLVAPLRTES
jgi:glycosyltransferase involved in cell wall biosynthesis